MPRSASKRRFGFQSPGILRVLTGSDPAEVLIAMEALGISFEDDPGFLDFLATALGYSLGPVDDLLSLISDGETLIRMLLGSTGFQFNRVQQETNLFLSRSAALRQQSENERIIFRGRIEEAQTKIAKGKPTSTI